MFKLLLAMLLVIGALYDAPLSMNVYSPLPAMMSPWSDRVTVTGRITYANGTAAASIQVTLFATDELIKDIVITNWDGYFTSSIKFDTGQIITVKVDNKKLLLDNMEPFINYDVQDSQGPFWLGTFVIP
jgi:hypothetical protein